MRCIGESSAIALVHEFVPIQPAFAAQHFDAYSPDAYDWRACHPDSMRMVCLDDGLIQRNMGCREGETGFFSGSGSFPGLQYDGVTLLEEAALAALTAPLESCGVIHPRDRYAISCFRRFCEETLRRGLWLVHFGV